MKKDFLEFWRWIKVNRWSLLKVASFPFFICYMLAPMIAGSMGMTWDYSILDNFLMLGSIFCLSCLVVMYLNGE